MNLSAALFVVIVGGINLLPCQGQDGSYPALLLIPKDKCYLMATNITEGSAKNSLQANIEAGSDEKIHQFCPSAGPEQEYENEHRNENRQWLKNALKENERMKPSDSVLIRNVCEFPVRAGLFKVHRPADSSNAAAEPMEYHIGYAIYVKERGFKCSHEKFDDVGEHFTIVSIMKLRVDLATWNTVSVSHVITNPHLLKQNRLPFDNSNFYEKDINDLYSDENQRKIINQYSKEESSKYFDYPNTFLVKVQLAPASDFLLTVWQEATYMEVNTAPMWQTLSTAWQSVEAYVRLAAELCKSKELQIETGVAEVWETPDPNTRKLYLDQEQKIAVPQFFWKLVTLQETIESGESCYSSIVIIMHNDPVPGMRNFICTDICEENEWFIGSEKYEHGLFYCCEVTEGIIERFKIHWNITPTHVLSLENRVIPNHERLRRNLAKPQFNESELPFPQILSQKVTAY